MLRSSSFQIFFAFFRNISERARCEDPIRPVHRVCFQKTLEIQERLRGSTRSIHSWSRRSVCLNSRNGRLIGSRHSPQAAVLVSSPEIFFHPGRCSEVNLLVSSLETRPWRLSFRPLSMGQTGINGGPPHLDFIMRPTSQKMTVQPD